MTQGIKSDIPFEIRRKRDCRKYYLKNKEKILEMCKKYHNKNKEKEYDRVMKWRKNNPEKCLEISKRYYKKMGEIFDLSMFHVKMALQNWSLVVRERDGNKCTKCGTTEKIHAHNILGKSEYPEFALIPANGITLCHECHWEVHRS